MTAGQWEPQKSTIEGGEKPVRPKSAVSLRPMQEQEEQNRATEMQVDEKVRAAADAAFATYTGGATPEAQEAIKTAIKHAMEVATEAGGKKAKLGRDSSPGEQRP